MKENAAISKKQMESLGISPNRSIGPNNLNSFVNRNSFQGTMDNAITPSQKKLKLQQISSESGTTGNMGIKEEDEDALEPEQEYKEVLVEEEEDAGPHNELEQVENDLNNSPHGDREAMPGSNSLL